MRLGALFAVPPPGISWSDLARAHDYVLVREGPRGAPCAGAELVFRGRGSGDEIRILLERADPGHDRPCFTRVRDLLVSYAGHELGGSGRRLLAALAARLERAEPQGVDDWLMALGAKPADQPVSRARESGTRPPDEPVAEEALVVHGNELELRVTLACNEQCPFCNTTDRSENVLDSPGRVLAAIEQAAEARARSVVLSGGEPTLCRDLPFWIEAARSRGLAVRVQTNGVVPGEPGYWQELRRRASARAMPNGLFLSFHTRHADRVRTVTGVGGTFDRKVAAVRSALEEGVAVELNFVVSSLNADEIADFPRFVHDRFGTDVPMVLSYVSPTGHAFGKPELLPRLRSIAAALASALDSAARLGVRATIPDPCGVPPCVLPKHPGSFPWLAARFATRPTATAIRRYGARCAGCELADRCSGFWCAYLDHYGDDELGP